MPDYLARVVERKARNTDRHAPRSVAWSRYREARLHDVPVTAPTKKAARKVLRMLFPGPVFAIGRIWKQRGETE